MMHAADAAGWGAAVEGFCAAAGIPVPPPMSEHEIRVWEAKQDAADVLADEFWDVGPGRAAA
ncbi:MAG TPA: hypothetical protein VFM55_07175 [Micromonosporaceae bacterium]|nr:hypothetical protein [Micromonosporaceae bacterium]